AHVPPGAFPERADVLLELRARGGDPAAGGGDDAAGVGIEAHEPGNEVGRGQIARGPHSRTDGVGDGGSLRSRERCGFGRTRASDLGSEAGCRDESDAAPNGGHGSAPWLWWLYEVKDRARLREWTQ